jgi:hypothetical protein
MTTVSLGTIYTRHSHSCTCLSNRGPPWIRNGLANFRSIVRALLPPRLSSPLLFPTTRFIFDTSDTSLPHQIIRDAKKSYKHSQHALRLRYITRRSFVYQKTYVYQSNNNKEYLLHSDISQVSLTICAIDTLR